MFILYFFLSMYLTDLKEIIPKKQINSNMIYGKHKIEIENYIKNQKNIKLFST